MRKSTRRVNALESISRVALEDGVLADKYHRFESRSGIRHGIDGTRLEMTSLAHTSV